MEKGANCFGLTTFVSPLIIDVFNAANMPQAQSCARQCPGRKNRKNPHGFFRKDALLFNGLMHTITRSLDGARYAVPTEQLQCPSFQGYAKERLQGD
jgi:hypothetical protein